MIHVTLTNEILKIISAIDKNRFSFDNTTLTPVTRNKLRKISKKKSSYASNRIEGNPPHPEIWVNYFLRMLELYSQKICELSESSGETELM